MDTVVLGTVVTPGATIERGWVAMRDGMIAAVGEGAPPAAAQVIDAGAGYVLPGIVDGQTHAGSYRGLPGIESTTRSAVAGGVTTIVDMPYDNPAPLNTVARLEEKKSAIATHAHADVALYGTIMPGQTTADILPLIEAGIAAFKVSGFESSPTRFPRIAADQILDLMEALAPGDVPVGIHNEDQEIVLARMAQARKAGGNGIALGAIAVWFMLARFESRVNGEGFEAAGALVAAAVILLLPVLVPTADFWGGLAGGLVGLLAGFTATRFHSPR